MSIYLGIKAFAMSEATFFCRHSERAKGMNTDTDNVRICKQLATTVNNFVPKVACFPIIHHA